MTSASRPPRTFDDLRRGERRASDPWTFTRKDMIRFSEEFDPQWFHCDPVEAAHSTYGRLIASGVHLLAVWRRLDHQMNGDIDFIGGVGMEDVRFRKAVGDGDSVRIRSEIRELRASRSKLERGTAVIVYEMTNQLDEIVLELVSTVLVRRPR